MATRPYIGDSASIPPAESAQPSLAASSSEAPDGSKVDQAAPLATDATAAVMGRAPGVAERIAKANAARAAMGPIAGTRLPMADIRAHCLECSGGEAKYVTWCTQDGVHSTRCRLWPFRFGCTPESVARRYGSRLVTPAEMPPAGIDLDRLPAAYREASTCDLGQRLRPEG